MWWLSLLPRNPRVSGCVVARWTRAFASAPRSPVAVPFALSADDALRAMQRWQESRLLAPAGMWQQAGRVKVRAAYQPFWAFDATVQSQFTGDVGFDYWTTRGSGKDRQQVLETTWRRLTFWHDRVASYSAHDPRMQAYASYRYPRAYIEKALSGLDIELARPLTSEMLRVPGVDVVEMESFTVRRDLAWGMALRRLRSAETRAAEQVLKQTYHADRVRNLQIHIALAAPGFRPVPVYMPSFVLEYSYLGSDFVAIVNGVDGRVGGESHYSPSKVGLGAGFAIAAVGALDRLFGAGHLARDILQHWTSMLFLPSLLAALAAYAFPRVVGYVRSLQQAWEQAEFGGSEYEAQADAYTRQYDDWRERHQRFEEQRQQQQQQQYQHQYRSYAGRMKQTSDPEGYYKLLGLKTDATEDEVKAAFRREALRWHPDRQSSDKDKAVAEEKFKAISRAYQVLRSPQKRAEYDASFR